MNDENDRPKDDDWAMSNPKYDLNQEKTEADFSDDFAPPSNQTSTDDWTMTTPNTNLEQHIPPSDDYGKTAPNMNIQHEDWEMNVPPNKPSENQPPEDWSMTTPNINLSADSDKTAPNINIPQENIPKEENAVNDEWMLSMPHIVPREPKKEGEWQMPQPVFRISSGKKAIPESEQHQTQHQPDVVNTGDQASFSNQTAPYFDKSKTNRESVPASQTQVSAPTAKKGSKLPFLIGGVFVFLFFSIAGLAAVYFVFLRGNETASVSNISKNNSDEPTLEDKPVSLSKETPNTTVNPENNLPKTIEYKGKMMLVVAGNFTMGSDSGEDISKPAHKVDLPAFYIDQTEVTNAQYKEFCDATGRNVPTPQYWNKDYFTARPNAPVVGISFEDAKAFAVWAGKRLPTEEEWEKAASWDEAKKEKYEYPWGNTFANSNAAFDIPELAEVGKYESGASPSGVLDMAGNAAEWVDAFFKPYPNSKATDENFGEKNRVVRGGLFNSKTNDRLKTTKRIYVPPMFMPDGETASYIGFRCAISADDPRLKEILSK